MDNTDCLKRTQARLQTSKQPTQPAPPKPKPASPDEYLARLSEEQRAALEVLRRRIKAVVPEATECICYQLPAFRLHGKFLVAYGAAKRHCAFYPGAVVEVLKDDLQGYEISKGTIRFSADKPLPLSLVQKLVKLRRASMAAVA